MKARKCKMCKQPRNQKDKRKKHFEWGKPICRWCAHMWVHDCC